MPELTVASGLARSFLEFAVARGAAEATLLARARIDRSTLDDYDARIPFAAYVTLVRTAKELCNDAAIALHFAEADDMANFSIVGLLTHASETMGEALTQLNRFGKLVVEVETGAENRFRTDIRGGGAWLVDTRQNPNDFPELTESTFARMTCGPRKFLPRPHVLEVHVTHPEPAHRAEYDRIFQCPVTFGAAWNALRMDPGVISHPVRLQPRYVFGVLSAHAEALLKELENSKTVCGRVESLLLPILHTGEIGMERIAEKMAMSRQTLYRALKTEGTTFEAVLDDLRHKQALNYLSGKKVSVNETAYLVGFSEPAAFSRAFKRWTGFSPQLVRQGTKPQ